MDTRLRLWPYGHSPGGRERDIPDTGTKGQNSLEFIGCLLSIRLCVSKLSDGMFKISCFT